MIKKIAAKKGEKMKVLLINGSPHENGCTFTALHRIAETLELQDVSTEIFHIGKTPVGGCMDCGYCAEKKICVIDDCVNRALKKSGGSRWLCIWNAGLLCFSKWVDGCIHGSLF